MRLDKKREELDRIDEDIIVNLADRMKIIEEVARIKGEEGIPAWQGDRVKEMQAKRRALAEKLGLDPDFISEIFDRIIKESMRIEEERINGSGNR